jgi:hypothetical protein
MFPPTYLFPNPETQYSLETFEANGTIHAFLGRPLGILGHVRGGLGDESGDKPISMTDSGFRAPI